ncbi:MAG: hypothetical protein KAS32_17465 [Candidatus Peribacteraceae bacterium]|nr:hypothetical protein [Candidatus Peribacteraceae bacterium]
MIRKSVLTLALLIGLILLSLPVGADTTTSMSVSNQTVSEGETFEVDIFLVLDTDSRGAQFDLTFDHNILTCNSVIEGGLFSLDGTQPTYWNEPIIDNRGNGQILGAACVIISPSMPVSGSGVLATINFTAKELGTSELVLSNVVVGDVWANSVEVIVTNGSVIVELEGDVNSDGRVNILDMILVGIHWEETGSLPEDLNNDGVVNILDSIIIGANWTG